MGPVRRAIVGFSFDKEASSNIAEQKIRKKAEGYLKRKLAVSHHIRRADYGGMDNLKFLYPINDVAAAVWVIRNTVSSEYLKQIVYVGSNDIKILFDASYAAFDRAIGGKQIAFAHEGENLSLYNTFMKGKEKLDEMGGKFDNPLIYFQAGDLPFLTNIDPILKDKDAESHDVVIDLNAKERIFGDFEFFKRNYYWHVSDQGVLRNVKEPNVWLLNMNNLDEKIVRYIAGTRKGGKLSMGGIIARAALRGASSLGIWKTIKDYRRYKKHKVVDCSSLERFGGAIIKGNVKVKARHQDVNRLIDIDSYEDWRFYEEVCSFVEEKKSEGLSYIYPYAEDIEVFRDRYMPGLRKVIPFLGNFDSFINQRFRTYGMDQPYEGGMLKLTGDEWKLEKAIEHYHKLLTRSEIQSGR